MCGYDIDEMLWEVSSYLDQLVCRQIGFVIRRFAAVARTYRGLEDWLYFIPKGVLSKPCHMGRVLSVKC